MRSPLILNQSHFNRSAIAVVFPIVRSLVTYNLNSPLAQESYSKIAIALCQLRKSCSDGDSNPTCKQATKSQI
ncbi:hypothetical protein [Nostoc sp.]|uniref:hypothetical protein n=1 Tax=Nostoc sp. TaxID=1180 RepID=UPI002FFAE5A3